MKVEITTTAKAIKVTNCIISVAISNLRKNQKLKDSFRITDKDLESVERLRKSLIRSIIKHKNN